MLPVVCGNLDALTLYVNIFFLLSSCTSLTATLSLLTDPQASPPSGGHRGGLQPGHAFLSGTSPGEEPCSAELGVRAAEGRGHQPVKG